MSNVILGNALALATNRESACKPLLSIALLFGTTLTLLQASTEVG